MYLMRLSALSFRRLSKPEIILLFCLDTYAFFFYFSSDLLTVDVNLALLLKATREERKQLIGRSKA